MGSITYADKIVGDKWVTANANEIKDIVNGKQDSISGIVIFCGDYDASSDLFPSSGGTLEGGVPAKGNQFYLSPNGGVLGGIFVPAGMMIMAKINTPGQILANWILPTAF